MDVSTLYDLDHFKAILNEILKVRVPDTPGHKQVQEVSKFYFLRSLDRVSADEFCAPSLLRYNVRITPPADQRSINLNSGRHDIHLHLYIIKIYESGILLLD